MSGLLLDTCAVIWLAQGEGLSQSGLDRLALAYEAQETIFISPITGWEIGMLSAKGRLVLTSDPHDWTMQFVERARISWTELTPRILFRSSQLPGNPHGDPADRIIMATAREHQYTLLTGDKAILGYGEKGYLQVHPC